VPQEQLVQPELLAQREQPAQLEPLVLQARQGPLAQREQPAQLEPLVLQARQGPLAQRVLLVKQELQEPLVPPDQLVLLDQQVSLELQV